MRNFSYGTVIQAGIAAIPDRDDGPRLRHFLDYQKRVILAGCAIELSVIRPTVREIAAALRMSPSNIEHLVRHWREMNWQDRHGWLTLVHGRLCDEANALDAAVRG